MNVFWQPVIVPYRLTLGLATLLGWHGHRSGSLSASGAVCAAALGFATLANPIRTFGVGLLAFYVSGSRITKFKAAYKATLEAPDDCPPGSTSSTKPLKPGGNRSAAQVACNALLGAACAVAWRVLYSGEVQLGQGRGSVWAKERWCVLDSGAGREWSRPLVLAAIGFFSACAGDTFASELGILSRSPPILLTTLQVVPPGTNGAVSAWGTTMSLCGGLLVGAAAAASLSLEDTVCPRFDVWTTLLVVGGVSGVIGSGIDSLLGATCQETLFSTSRKMVVHSKPPSRKAENSDDVKRIAGRPLLSNNGVNLVASGVTAGLVFWWTC